MLAIVQGITEFLPISSSGHLVLLPAIAGWPDQGPVLDVAVHVGTLGAVLVYFRRDVGDLSAGLGDLTRPDRRRSTRARLALGLLLATLPIVIVGFAVAAFEWQHALRSPVLIAVTTVGFAVLLYLSDRFRPTARGFADLGPRDAVLIGLAQVLALLPGTSRSGITMTMARALRLDRISAARYSMLLSIPTILGAGLLAAIEIAGAGDLRLGLDALIAAALAWLAAWLAIAGMMRWLARASFTPFVVYRLLLGAGLFWWLYA